MNQSQGKSRSVSVLLVAATLLAVAWLDWVTGFELSTFIFYVLPISLAVWRLGSWAGFFTSLASGVLWVVADVDSGHRYSDSWILWANAGQRLSFFLFVSLSLGYMRRTLLLVRKREELFNRTIPVCSSCHSIGSTDGDYSDPATFLESDAGCSVSRKLCPDCARRAQHTGFRD